MRLKKKRKKGGSMRMIVDDCYVGKRELDCFMGHPREGFCKIKRSKGNYGEPYQRVQIIIEEEDGRIESQT